MRANLIVLSLAVCTLFASCNQEKLIRDDDSAQSQPVSVSHYQTGVIDVKVVDGALFETKAASAAELESLGIISMERIFPDAGEWEPRHKAAGLDRWYRVVYDPSVARTKAESSFASFPGVEAVDTPRKIKPMTFNYFNDPYLYYQWHYYNDGTLTRHHKKGSDINVVPVWEKYTAGSKDVVVAVVDAGVDMNHEDLKGVVLPGGVNGSKNFCAGQVGYTIVPGEHGTHVAGTIAAINNNGKGAGGVAGGKDGKGGVRIMSCQIFGVGSGDSASALVWAADNGACIANNSWGYEFDYEADAKSYANTFLKGRSAVKDAIDYFVEYAGTDVNGKQVGPMKGGVCIFSAGNGDKNGIGIAYGIPAIYDPVVAVAACGPDYTVAAYSNYGPWVDIIAPGGADSSTAQDLVLSLLPGNDYGFMAGTSMSAPHVSGVAALLLSYFGGPGFTKDDLISKLVWGANFDAIKSGDKYVGGMLDALGSFQFNDDVLPTITTDYDGGYIFRSHEQVVITYNIEDNINGRFEISFESPDKDAVTAEVSSDKVVMSIDALKLEPGTYKAAIVVGKGTDKEYSYPIPFEVMKNNAPANKAAMENIVIAVSKGNTNIDLSQYFKDEDGETLNYVCTSSNDKTISASVAGSSLTLKGANYGESYITVTASDARGESCKQGFRVLSRDGSKLVDLYPVPMSEVLNIRPGMDYDLEFSLYSSTGARVRSLSQKVGPFTPVAVNVSDLAAGTYTAVVKLGDEEYRQDVVKF